MENVSCESFNAGLRDDLLKGEIFYLLSDTEILIKPWCRHHNTIAPHSALGYRPPMPEVITLVDQSPAMH